MNKKGRIIVGLVIGTWITAHWVIQFGPKLEYVSGYGVGVLIGYLAEPVWKYMDPAIDRAINRLVLTLRGFYHLWKRTTALLPTFMIH